MDLVLGRGEFDRQRGAFVPWRQENCLLEPAKADPKQYNVLSRPPLVSAYSWSSGPVHGVFWKPGLFGGAKFAVIGANLYMDGVSLGAINGTGPVSWAAGVDELVLTRGMTAYSYNGTDLQPVAFPDGADVLAVNWMARLFVYVRAGSGRFYWSAEDDGRTVDGLSFANAESEQDVLLDIMKTGDIFRLMGANTIEAWLLTGDVDLPWTKVSQGTLNRGVRDTGCSEEIEGTVYFVANDGMVCMIQNSAARISDAALDEKIRQSATAQTFWFQYEGKPLFCIRLDSGTYVLDLALDNQPCVFSTSGRGNWAPKCAVNVNADPLFGDDTNGTIWQFSEGATTDSGAVEMPRVFSIGAAANALKISNVILNGNAGSATVETGESADPIMELRYSRDGGRTFSPWRGARWGKMGDYMRQARFGSCGQFGPPGFLAEVRVLACAPLRVASARANESVAGRGRI